MFKFKKPYWWRWRLLWLTCLIGGALIGYGFMFIEESFYIYLSRFLNSSTATGIAVGLTIMDASVKMFSKRNSGNFFDEDFLDRVLSGIPSSLLLASLGIVKATILFWISPFKAQPYPYPTFYIYGIGILALAYSIKTATSSIKWIFEQDDSERMEQGKIPGIEGIKDSPNRLD